MADRERIVIGNDPGTATNLALVSSTRGWIDFADGSRTSVKVSKTRSRPSAELIRAVLAEWAMLDEVEMVIEKIGAWTGQGLVSSAEFVGSMRLVQGVAVGMGIPVTFYTPASWKRGMKLIKTDKDFSRAVAAERWPAMAQHLSRKMDHNRAEAALLAQHHIQETAGR